MTYSSYLPKKSSLLLLALASAPAIAFGQILSNGTGGGAWESPSTWANGSVPGTGSSGNFRVVEGDTVTADNLGVIQSNTSNREIYGTFNVNGNTSVSIGRLNSSVESHGTLNLNGGSFSVSRLAQNNASRFILNVSGGEFTVRDSIAITSGLTLNLSGGTFRSGPTSLNGGSGTGAIVKMTGGSLIYENGIIGISGLTTGEGSWNGGTVYANTSSLGITTVTGLFTNALSSSANNIYALSSKLESQTTTIDGPADITQGTLAFNIYSSAANDSDQFVFNSQSLNIGENVNIDIRGVGLEGILEDYIGTSYQIFSGSDYSSIAASVTSGPVTIGGTTYDDIYWNTADLASLGTIVLVPEPSTYALMFGAAAIGLAVIRKRRKQS